LAVICFFFSTIKAEQPVQVLHGHVHPTVANGEARLVGRLPSTQRMSLSIVLLPRNQAQLTRLLGSLYDASSPNYHKFLSVSEFTDQFAPSAEDYRAVMDFARANGFTVANKPANRLVVSIRGTAAQVEAAFQVKMNVYQHPTESRTFFSPDREPSLALNVPVAHIAGLNNYSIPKPMVTRSTTTRSQTAQAKGSGPGGSYLGSDMRAAYYGGTTLTGQGQTVGLVQFDGYSISDVTSTFDGKATSTTAGTNYVLSYTPQSHGTTYTIPINNVLLDGATGAAASGDDSEEVLDIVQSVCMAPGLS
jgi:subtilase family serine protease